MPTLSDPLADRTRTPDGRASPASIASSNSSSSVPPTKSARGGRTMCGGDVSPASSSRPSRIPAKWPAPAPAALMAEPDTRSGMPSPPAPSPPSGTRNPCRAARLRCSAVSVTANLSESGPAGTAAFSSGINATSLRNTTCTALLRRRLMTMSAVPSPSKSPSPATNGANGSPLLGTEPPRAVKFTSTVIRTVPSGSSSIMKTAASVL